MSLTADTVASQLLWPGDLLQSATVTIKVSWVWGWRWGGGGGGGRSSIREWRSSVHVTDSRHCGIPASLAWGASPVRHSHHQGQLGVGGVRVEGQLLWPGDLLQSATVTIRSVGWSCGWGGGGVRGGRSNIRDWSQVSMSLTAVTVASKLLWPGGARVGGGLKVKYSGLEVKCPCHCGIPASLAWRASPVRYSHHQGQLGVGGVGG